MDILCEETGVEAADGIKVTKHDDKTDETFQKFEEQVDQHLQKTSKAIMGFIQDKNGLNIQIPENLGDTVSSRAQEMLGKLDNNLEKVEELTQGYWNKMSNKSFWSSMANSISTQFQEALDLDGNAQKKESESSRESIAETKLRQLSIDKSIYLDFNTDLLKGVDGNDATPKLEEKSAEISDLLSKDKDLKSLHDDLVPSKITDDIFWTIYFVKKSEILNLASKKREIIDVKKEHDKEQQIGWDDEEEDSTEEIIPSSHSKVKSSSVEKDSDKNTTSSNLSKTDNAEEEDDDDDDDWE